MRVLSTLLLAAVVSASQLRKAKLTNAEKADLVRQQMVAEELLRKHATIADALIEATENLVESVNNLAAEPNINDGIDGALDILQYATNHYQEIKAREKEMQAAKLGLGL